MSTQDHRLTWSECPACLTLQTGSPLHPQGDLSTCTCPVLWGPQARWLQSCGLEGKSQEGLCGPPPPLPGHPAALPTCLAGAEEAL